VSATSAIYFVFILFLFYFYYLCYLRRNFLHTRVCPEMEEGGRRVVDELNRRMAESVDKLNWQYQQDFAFMTGRPWPRNVGSVVSLDKPFLDTPFCVATDQRMAAQTAEGSAVAEGSAEQLVVQSHSEKKARVAVQSSLGKRASPEAALERQRDQAQRERDLAVFQCAVKEKQRDLAQKQCTAVKKELDLARINII
jgi:hypothetical protein